MNRAQFFARLETIIGKLEDLQNADHGFSQEEIDAMRSAKSALLRILK